MAVSSIPLREYNYYDSKDNFIGKVLVICEDFDFKLYRAIDLNGKTSDHSTEGAAKSWLGVQSWFSLPRTKW